MPKKEELPNIIDLRDVGGIPDLRYDGRTVKITCYINTQENQHVLAERISKFIKHTGDKPMVLTHGEMIHPDAVQELWNETLAIIRSGRTPEN